MSFESDALNRVADALFQLAKAERAHVKLIVEQVSLNKQVTEATLANLAVTRQLEAALLLQTADVGGHA